MREDAVAGGLEGAFVKGELFKREGALFLESRFDRGEKMVEEPVFKTGLVVEKGLIERAEEFGGCLVEERMFVEPLDDERGEVEAGARFVQGGDFRCFWSR